MSSRSTRSATARFVGGIPAPICAICSSRAYIRHLFAAEEMLAMRFAVMHNLYFYNTLMARIRTAIEAGKYETFRKNYSSVLDMRI